VESEGGTLGPAGFGGSFIIKLAAAERSILSGGLPPVKLRPKTTRVERASAMRPLGA
jgi:hypothetical protein